MLFHRNPIVISLQNVDEDTHIHPPRPELPIPSTFVRATAVAFEDHLTPAVIYHELQLRETRCGHIDVVIHTIAIGREHIGHLGLNIRNGYGQGVHCNTTVGVSYRNQVYG